MSFKTREILKENVLLVAFIIYLIILPFAVPYPALATEILIYGMLALTFILLLGYVGLLDFGTAAFFAIGAYSMGLLLKFFHIYILLGMFISVLITTFFALAIGFLCLRRGGIYFALLTLAFNEMIFFIIYEWRDLTGGDSGLHHGIRPDLAPFLSLQPEINFYFFTLIFFVAVFYLLLRLIHSPFGSVLQAIRENELRTTVLGYNVDRFKLTAFVLAGAIRGLAGSLFAMYQKFVGIEIASWVTSGNVIIMSLMGGVGSLFGGIVGATIFIIASDILSAMWERWLLIIGIVFVAVVLFIPGGVWAGLEILYNKLRLKSFVEKISS